MRNDLRILEVEKFINGIKYRAIIIFSIYIIFSAIFVYKAFVIQVTRTDPRLQALLEKQQINKIKLTPRRGEILDSNLNELAISIKMFSLYANPYLISNKNEVINSLSSLLSIPKGILKEKLYSKKKFVWIKRLIDEDKANEIRALNIRGLNFIEESKRFYPNGTLLSNVLGFAGIDSKGLEGLELQYDQKLLGKEQVYTVKIDAKGRPILAIVNNFNDINQNTSNSMIFSNYVSKENLVLTIDKELQYFIEQALKNSVLKHKALSGDVIVMDPNSGKIIAMANYPSYDPNNFAEYPTQYKRNRAIADMFEPGSIFKIFTFAIAFDLNVLSLNEKIFCENGRYKIGKNIISEAGNKKFSYLTPYEIFKHSSNIGTVKIIERISKDIFYNYLLKFNFGSKTQIDLPGEASGIVTNSKRWTPIDKANISFGQGISVTSIQVISAFSALINGGTYYKPYIVDKIIDNDKKVIYQNNPVVFKKNIVKPSTINLLKKILYAPLESDGTGALARIDNLDMGGKTGTAQKVNYDTKSYFHNKHVTSFIGAFPIKNPKYVIFVKIDDPQNNAYASTTAVPLFKEIVDYMASDEINKKILIADKREGKKYKKNKLTKSANIANSNLTISIKQDNNYIEIPDLKNYTLRQTLKILNGIDLKYEIHGAGKVVAQYPEPNSKIKKGSKIKIYLE